MKVVFVHDWLVTYRGGEKVLDALLELYPNAPIYTLFYNKSTMPDSINSHRVITPRFLNSFKKLRKLALPLYPYIIEAFNLEKADLIISTSSCVAKGVKNSQKVPHFCYIHSPMRYIWDQQDIYLEGVKHIPFASWGIKKLTPRLRKWDITSSNRGQKFVANSNFVAHRVKKYYNRSAQVIHPPIEVEQLLNFSRKKKEDYFIIAGAFVSYKKFDLAIKVCNKLKINLKVVGSGPMEKQLRELAGETVEFIISPNNQNFRSSIQRAQALIFPGVEDFGMIAIEAMALGTPVIALNQGGALDFITSDTGAFFTENTENSLLEAIKKFEANDYSPDKLADFSLQFNKASFKKNISSSINDFLNKG